jgi:hypothetical protein
MRNVVFALSFAGLAALANIQPTLADCRSENAACIRGAGSPFDAVACGSLNRTCAAHQAQAAQRQANQRRNINTPATQNAPHASGGDRSGRR